MTKPPSTPQDPSATNVDSKFASEITSILDQHAHATNEAVSARLKQTRHLAIERHRALHTGAQQMHQQGVVAVFSAFFLHHARIWGASLFVLSALIVAVMITQPFSLNDAPEDGDAYLLGSELPPEAFLDKGFDKWIEQADQR